MFLGFPGGSVVKNLPDNAGPSGDAGLIPGLDRSPGGGNGKPFQYSCQDNPLHSGAWQATVHEVAKSRTWLDILYVCAQICFHIDKWPNQYHILLERMFFLPFFLSKDVLSTPQGKENMFSQNLYLIVPGPLPMHLFPFANFNLWPFTVITCNHTFNSFS